MIKLIENLLIKQFSLEKSVYLQQQQKLSPKHN